MLWKFLKILFLTPASIYIGKFFIEFYSKIEYFFADSLELIRFIDKNTFPIYGMLFTIDFESLYTNIPVKDAIKLITNLLFTFQNKIPNAHLVVTFGFGPK